MKLRPIFVTILVLSGLLLSAFGSFPAAGSAVEPAANQITVTAPPVVNTVIPATVLVPVTGDDGPNGWTLLIYGLLVLLGIALLLALFAPRRTHDHHHGDTHPPSDV